VRILMLAGVIHRDSTNIEMVTDVNIQNMIGEV